MFKINIFLFFTLLFLVGCNPALQVQPAPSKLNFSPLAPNAPLSPNLNFITGLTSRSAVIAWSPSLDGGGEVGSYRLEYGTSSTLSTSTQIPNVAAPYTLSDLQPSTTYFVRVTALNSSGSAPSTIRSFTTYPLPVTAPALQPVTTTQTGATINWTGGDNASSYSLFYGQDMGLTSSTEINAIQKPYSISGLSPNTLYFYKIKATNAAGSAESPVGSFMTLINPPGVPILGVATTTQTSSILSWTAGDGGMPTSFNIKYSTSMSLVGSSSLNGVTTPATINNLSPGTVYYYQVTALNASGASDSAIGFFTTAYQPPGAPVLGASSVTQNAATLSWSAGAGGTPVSYNISYGTTANLSGATVLNNVTSPRTLSGLSAGTVYYYKVTAVNQGGNADSPISSLTTSLAPPAAPILGTVTPAQTSAGIAWTSGTGGGAPASYSLSYGTSSTLAGATTVANVSSIYNLTGLTASAVYYYSVSAINSAGSTSSVIGSFTTSVTAPGAPVLGAVTADITTASVTWSQATTGGTPTSYNFLLSTNSALTGATPVTGATSPRSLTGLIANTTYYYQVIALNSSGQMASSIGSFTTKPLAPAAPALGTITPQQTSAAIAWSAGSGGGIPASYSLSYGTSSTLIGATNVANVTSVYNLSGLVANTLYYYRITATNISGSTSSSIASFTTLALAPGAPVIAGVTTITSTSAVVTWSANPTSGPPQSYNVRYATNSSFTNAVSLTNAISPLTLSGLSAASNYYVEVTAVNMTGNASSTTSFTTLPLAPGAPILGTLTPTQNAATINWSVGTSGGLPTSYHLTYGTSATLAGATTVNAVTTPYSLSGLTANTLYYVRITAVNASGSTNSTIGSFTTLPMTPGAPTLGALSALSANSASLTWTAATSGGAATSFDVQWGTSSTLAGATIVSGATSPLSLNSLTANTTYYYQVIAKNSSGSTNSVIGSFTTSILAPVAPTLAAVTPAQTSASIAWSAGTGGGTPSSYNLTYGTSSTLSVSIIVSNVTSPYNLTGLTANTVYYYRVTAINTTGSANSVIGTFTTAMMAPGAPALGVVTPDITSASIAWSAAATGGTPTSYNLLYGTNSALTGATTVSGVTSPRSLTGLSASTTYFYQIVAINTTGQASSSIGTFTTKPLVPTAPVIGTIAAMQTSASIPWTMGAGGGAVSSYSLTYGTSSTLAAATTVSNVSSAYSLTGLLPSTLYYVKITATNTSGSADSTISSFTTLAQAPGIPTLGAVGSITTNSVVLTWSPASSGGAVTSYDLKWGTSSTLTTATTVTGVTSPRTLSSLVGNTTYYYQIIAKNSTGSTNSAIASFTTLLPGPDAPVLGAVTNITQSTATVSWSAGPSVSLNSFTTTLHPVAMNRCTSCHSVANYSTSAHGSTTASVAHDAMFFIDTLNRKKVDFAIPTQSRLYTKVMEGHQCGTACGPEILTAINSWIAAGGGTGGLASAYRLEYSTSSSMTNPTQVTSATSPQLIQGLLPNTTYYYRVVALNTTSSTNSTQGSFQTLASTGAIVVDYGLEILMGDRRYVDSVLRDVFDMPSDSVAPGTTIRDNIYRKAEFGGACDVYAPVLTGASTVENVPETCFAGLDENTRANSNAPRYALVTKTCHTMVGNATAMANVYTKLFGTTSAGVVDDPKLTLAYQLFYPDDPLNATVKASLYTLANTQSTNDLKWKMIILGLCVSPEWQSL